VKVFHGVLQLPLPGTDIDWEVPSDMVDLWATDIETLSGPAVTDVPA
jgi:hypothetical protein